MHGLPPDALVEKHLWIVDRFAASYRKIAPRGADLDAAGRLGLCEAAQRFRPRKGAAFSTYAWNWVKGAVLSELRRSHVVPVPEHTVRAACREGKSVHGVVVFDVPESAPDDAEPRDTMRSRALHQAVERLRPLYRHVINRTLAGRSPAQIAFGLGLTEARIEEILELARVELSWMMDG